MRNLEREYEGERLNTILKNLNWRKKKKKKRLKPQQTFDVKAM